MFDRVEEKIFKPVRRLCTFAAVSVLWLLFSAQSVGQWRMILSKALHMQRTVVSEGMMAAFDLPENQLIYNLTGLNEFAANLPGLNMVIFILAACLICFVPENNYKKKHILNTGSLLLASLAFVWGVLCLGAESTFVYFGF